jgi:hypothetical protein
VPKHNSNLTDTDFGYFLAGLIEGDGWFNISLAKSIYHKTGYSVRL